ncbi:hypothetical protein ACJX0J_021289, partial [Zea mays]
MAEKLRVLLRYQSLHVHTYFKNSSEKLKEGEDIYIYQGDKSFCSTECRENFMVDEMEGKGGWKHLFCMGAAWRELIGRKQTLTRFLNVPREKGISWDLLFIQGKKISSLLTLHFSRSLGSFPSLLEYSAHT